MEGEGAYTIVDGHKMTLGAQRFRADAERHLARAWRRSGPARPASGRTGSTSRWSMRSRRISTPCIPSSSRRSDYPVDDMTQRLGQSRACGRPRANGRRATRRCSSTSGSRPTRRCEHYAEATDGSPFDGVHHELRQSGHRRAGHADDRRRHADAAAGRAHQGAPAHRQLRLSGARRAKATRSSAASASTGEERDIFCVPSWAWHEHGNASDQRRRLPVHVQRPAGDARRSASTAKRPTATTADSSLSMSNGVS